MKRSSWNTRFVAAGKKPQRKGDYGRKSLSTDHGQRWEVRYQDGLNAWHIWTWTDEQADIDRAFADINNHPIFHSPTLVDRRRTLQRRTA